MVKAPPASAPEQVFCLPTRGVTKLYVPTCQSRQHALLWPGSEKSTPALNVGTSCANSALTDVSQGPDIDLDAIPQSSDYQFQREASGLL